MPPSTSWARSGVYLLSISPWGASHRSETDGVLVIKRGEIVASRLQRTWRSALHRLAPVKLLAAKPLGHAGRIADRLTAIEEAVDYSDHNEERWMIGELLRVKGELRMLQGADGALPAARDHVRKALDRARQQGAVSSELPAPCSLAPLLAHQGRSAAAAALRQPLYDRNYRGFDTAALRALGSFLRTI